MNEEKTPEQQLPSHERPLPELEETLQAIGYGEYDGNFEQIYDALDARREARREQVMAQVREVFGESAEVVLPDTSPLARLFKKTIEDEEDTSLNRAFPKKEKPNPFVTKAERKAPPIDPNLDAALDVPLPGSYRRDPRDGNSYRMERIEGNLARITDIFGGHEGTVLKSVWDSWVEVEVDEPTPDALASIDPKVEVINSGEQLPFEQRGAIVGGLSAGDIGE